MADSSLLIDRGQAIIASHPSLIGHGCSTVVNRSPSLIVHGDQAWSVGHGYSARFTRRLLIGPGCFAGGGSGMAKRHWLINHGCSAMTHLP
jgi:hypothetical protein